VNIVALVAAHNRSGLTKRLLRGLENQNLPDNVSIQVVAVDDGSSDSTLEVLRSSPLVKDIHLGDGSLYWAKSMAIAEKRAFEAINLGKKSDEYFLLWLNDDVEFAQSVEHHDVKDGFVSYSTEKYE
jgi:glycosyltransferase involved in cell wall biosynthesis